MTSSAQLKILEEQTQSAICNLCDYLHLKWFHNPDSRRVNPGLPDLIIIGPRGVIYVELKSRTGELRKAQEETIVLLRQSQQRVFVWRHTDLFDGTVLRELSRIVR